MVFVSVLLPIGDNGQALAGEAAGREAPAPGEQYLVLHCPRGVGKVRIVAALQAAGLRVAEVAAPGTIAPAQLGVIHGGIAPPQPDPATNCRPCNTVNGTHRHCEKCRPTLAQGCACETGCHDCDEASSEHARYVQRANSGNGRDC